MACCVKLLHQFLGVQTPALYTEYWPAHMPSSYVRKNHLQVFEVQRESSEVHAIQMRMLTAYWKNDIELIPILSPVPLKMTCCSHWVGRGTFSPYELHKEKILGMSYHQALEH